MKQIIQSEYITTKRTERTMNILISHSRQDAVVFVKDIYDYLNEKKFDIFPNKVSMTKL